MRPTLERGNRARFVRGPGGEGELAAGGRSAGGSLRLPALRDFDPPPAVAADRSEELGAGRCGGEVDRDEPVREALGQPLLELECLHAGGAHGDAKDVARVLAA